jgi:hypothetical protein
MTASEGLQVIHVFAAVATFHGGQSLGRDPQGIAHGQSHTALAQINS